MAVEIAFWLISVGVEGEAAVIIGTGIAAGGSALAYSAGGQILSGLINGGGNQNMPGYSPSGLGMSGSSDSVSNGRAQGLLINESNNVAPIPIIYGNRKVGGTRAFIDVYGEVSEWLDMVIVLAEGEIDSVPTIYLDDVPSTSSKFADNVYTETYVGTDTQAASAEVIRLHPDKWTVNHTGSGIAYIVVRLWYDPEIFNSVPTITADVKGKKVLDLRTSTVGWSNNPALCIYDYLTNTRYGRGIAPSAIDTASFIESANYCDEMVEVPGGTQHRYELDGVVDINATAFDNIKSMLTSCRGMLIYSAGKYKLMIDKPWTGSTFNFNEDNITGGWTITQPGRRSKINRVTAGIFNTGANWQPDYAIVDAPAFRALDNGLLLEDKLDLPFTSDLARGCQLAGLHMKQTRYGLVVEFTALQVGLRCEVGDVFSVTHSTPGWTGKRFRCMEMQLTSDDEISVRGLEYSDYVYGLASLTTITAPPPISLGNPFEAKVPANLTLTSGSSELLKLGDGSIVSRIKCGWDIPTTVFITQSELQYKLSTDTVWSTFSRPAPALGKDWISPVLDAAVYNVRLRFQNSIGIFSAWAEATHTVIGKTEPPADVTQLMINGQTLSWPPVADIDLAGYVLRFNYGSNPAWGTATPINSGVITQSPFDWTLRPAGQITVLIKAVDTTGNESVQATPLYTDLGDSPIANVVEEHDYTLLFAGTLTGCEVQVGGGVGGLTDILVANTVQGFYPDGNQPMYPSGTLPFYPALVYGAMVYETEWHYISGALVGSLLTLLLSYAGTGLRVEYRTGNPEPLFGGDELEPFYTPDADPLYGADPVWQLWPGQITAQNDVYQFRITIGSGTVRGRIDRMALIIDAPDMEETIDDLPLDIGGTALPYTKPFTVIKGIQATLQAGGSGAVNILTTKTNNLAPVATAVNSSLVAVAGASGDFTLKGY